MATWEDGPEYAPYERPDEFADPSAATVGLEAPPAVPPWRHATVPPPLTGWPAIPQCRVPGRDPMGGAAGEREAGVLLGDLIEQGLIRIQATITDNTSTDERLELIERTLRGLRNY